MMKTKIFPILFAFTALFTANQASAYYSPSTGRWLSRDPNGEPGFETLRSASAMPRVGQIASTASLPPSRLFVRDSAESKKEPNRYEFVANNPIGKVDWLGLASNPCGADECKCLGCIVHSEARGTADACQKAVADVVKQRAWNPYRSFCDVVAERNGGEFYGYKTSNYSDCCNDKCENKPKGPQNKTERDKAFKNSECDGANTTAAGSYAPGANYFNNAKDGVPSWIQIRIDAGKAYEVNVPGCSTFLFFHVDPL